MERRIKNTLLQWFRRRVETPSESNKNDVEKTLKSKKQSKKREKCGRIITIRIDDIFKKISCNNHLARKTLKNGEKRLLSELSDKYLQKQARKPA